MAKTRNPELELKRRQQLVGAAGRLLAGGSHRDLTLERVAREAGVSKGMLTYYYASKDQLLTETIVSFFALQEQAVIAIVEDENVSLAVRMQRLVELALPSTEALSSELGFLVEVWSLAKRDPAVMSVVRAAYLRFRGHCERMIEVAAARGHVKATDHRWINLVLLALLDGLSIQLAMDEQLDPAGVRAKVVTLFEQLLAV